jgi:hypothetical protein
MAYSRSCQSSLPTLRFIGQSRAYFKQSSTHPSGLAALQSRNSIMPKRSAPKSPDLETGNPVTAQYLLSPRLEDELLPVQPEKPQRQFIDVLVLIELLRKTTVREEIEAAVEQLRPGQWSGIHIGSTLFENGKLILQHCS